jgi:hypothetical protein
VAVYLKVSLKRFHAIEVTRIAIGNQKLVYALIANKKFRHPYGKSSIAYIGTTKKGIHRVASSVAYRAEDIPDRLPRRSQAGRFFQRIGPPFSCRHRPAPSSQIALTLSARGGASFDLSACRVPIPSGDLRKPFVGRRSALCGFSEALRSRLRAVAPSAIRAFVP